MLVISGRAGSDNDQMITSPFFLNDSGQVVMVRYNSPRPRYLEILFSLN